MSGKNNWIKICMTSPVQLVFSHPVVLLSFISRFALVPDSNTTGLKKKIWTGCVVHRKFRSIFFARNLASIVFIVLSCNWSASSQVKHARIHGVRCVSVILANQSSHASCYESERDTLFWDGIACPVVIKAHYHSHQAHDFLGWPKYLDVIQLTNVEL